jgi:hypothetical protein
MKLGVALHELHRSERSLAHRIRRVGERHKADHEIFYGCRDIAEWSESHIRRELLAQGAQAAKDTELLALASRCHPDTLRQMRWANTMLKSLSPQTLMN